VIVNGVKCNITTYFVAKCFFSFLLIAITDERWEVGEIG